jgi:hypothetical protein
MAFIWFNKSTKRSRERRLQLSGSSRAAKGKFEIERDGQVSFLAYETDGSGWISLLHTWVSPVLRGRGIANELAQIALEYAKDNHLKVEVVCPVVFHFVSKHSEYKPLVGIRGYTTPLPTRPLPGT